MDKFIFFILFYILAGCSDNEQSSPVLIQLDEEKEVSITKPVEIDYCSGIPDRACPYVDLLQLSDNTSRHAAQIDQESNFNPFAKSPYAYGIAQFTEDTGKWAASSFCKDLGPFQKYDADWGLKCSIRYMEYLQKNNHYGGYCTNRKIAEQEYNGGAWVIWEINYAGSYSGAENICGKATLSNGRKRASWACKENYEYPKRISKRQNEFLTLGGKKCS